MELIKLAARRSAWGDAIYVILNLAYAAVLFGLVLAFTPPWLAYLVVVLSKWRVFAVRPRFWFANMQASVADVLVGLSFVTLVWLSGDRLLLQILLLGLFVAWLIFVKPRSSRGWVKLQAGLGQFFGLTALMSLTYESIASVVVLAAWLIGYAMARHVLTSFADESERTLISLVWGLVIAQLAWLAHHWTIAYTVSGGVKVPQVAITAGLLGFLAVRVYEALRSEDKQRFRALRWPITLVIVIVLTLMIWFNGLDMTQL